MAVLPVSTVYSDPTQPTAYSSPLLSVDGDISTFATRPSGAGGGDKSAAIIFDFGSAVEVGSFFLYGDVSGTNYLSGHLVQVSTDTTSWTTLPGTTTGATPDVWTRSGSAVNARYLRLLYSDPGPGLRFYPWIRLKEVGFDGSTTEPEEPPPPPGGPVTFTINEVTFDRLVEKKVRIELNGTGSGHFVIARGDAQATEANLARGNIVEVTIPQIHSGVLFEFILETGDFDLISSEEEGGEELSFGGRGTMAVLERARLDYQQYLDPVTDVVFPDRGIWEWDTETEGNIIRRMIDEAQNEDLSGEGITRIGPRPTDPIPFVTRTFDEFDDTAGVSWGDETLEGNWTAPIGSDLLTEILRLATAGLLSVEMIPDFVFNAYRDMGIDRTSTTFATDKIRFVKGVNIVDELGKAMAGAVFASDAIVRKADGGYTRATLAGTHPYDAEAYIESASSNTNTAIREAQGHLGLREEAQEALVFAHLSPITGQSTDESTGLYLPGPTWSDHGLFWVGDLVTLHTGTSDFDYNNITQRVYAITLYEDEVGELAPPIVELNAPFATRETVNSGPNSAAAGATGTSGGGSSGGGTTTGPHNHTAGAVPFTPAGTIAATNTQDAVEEVATDAAAALTGHTGDTTDAHDASAVSFTPAGTIAATNVQDAIEEVAAEAGGSALPWFDVTTYGATGDGVTDDTAEINLAIAALNTATVGTLYFPAGEYLVSAALTALTAKATIAGEGIEVSQITCSSATAALFTASDTGTTFRDLRIANSATASAGGAIIATGGTGNRYENLWLSGFWIGIDQQAGAAWAIRSCIIQTPRKYAVKVSNTGNPDEGDWSISDSVFSGIHGNDALIRIESSGGGKIVNCKLNGATTFPVRGIDVVFASVVSTILLIANNSIENVSGDAIRIATTGTGKYGLIGITNNQVGLYSNNTGRAVAIVAASTGGFQTNGGIGHVVIDGLVAHTDGTARAAVALTNTDNVVLGAMSLSGFNARYTGSGDTNTTDGSSSSLTVEDEGSALATAATTLDFVGAGVTASGTGAEKTITIPGGASTLDGLTDVTITSPADADRLRYNGSAWVNSNLHWEPMTDYDGLVMIDSGGGIHVHEVSH